MCKTYLIDYNTVFCLVIVAKNYKVVCSPNIARAFNGACILQWRAESQEKEIPVLRRCRRYSACCDTQPLNTSMPSCQARGKHSMYFCTLDTMCVCVSPRGDRLNFRKLTKIFTYANTLRKFKCRSYLRTF